MDIILTESQYMQLLVEKNENKIASVFEKSKDFTKKLILTYLIQKIFTQVIGIIYIKTGALMMHGLYLEIKI